MSVAFFYQLGCSDYVFSNSFLEDLERLWELRSIIPDPCNPNTVVNEKSEGIEEATFRYRFRTNLLQTPLISAVVAPNLYLLAIAPACVRSYFDKPHNLHSNGELNQHQISSHGVI